MAGRRQCASSRIGWDPAPAGERATFPRACAPGDGIDIVPVSLDGVCIPGSRNNAHLLPSLESLHSHGRRLCATKAFSRIAAISKPPTALVRNGSGICPLPVENDRRSALGPAARGSGGGGARPPARVWICPIPRAIRATAAAAAAGWPLQGAAAACGLLLEPLSTAASAPHRRRQGVRPADAALRSALPPVPSHVPLFPPPVGPASGQPPSGRRPPDQARAVRGGLVLPPHPSPPGSVL